MKSARRLGLALLTAACAAPAADAPQDNAPPADAGRFREVIVKRNAFGLKEPAPPPPPPTNAPAPPPDKVDVKLSGISQIGTVRYAHLMLPDKARAGQFLYPTLTDDPAHGNTRSDAIEVLAIDPAQETVRIRNAGFEMQLSFGEHGVKAPAAPAPVPGRPGGPNPAVVNAIRAGAVASGQLAAPLPNNNAGPVIFSSRAGVATDGSPPLSPTARAVNEVNAQAGAFNAATSVTRPLRTSGGGVPQPNYGSVGTGAGGNVPAAPAVPVEQQFDNMVRQSQAAQSAGLPFPPIPGVQPEE
jgi:hypothetical protein